MELTTKFYHGFLKLAECVLIVTCLAKLLSAFGAADALTLPDVLFGWENRWVMLLAAFVEAFVVGILLSKLAPLMKLGSILWLSLNFAVYRICLWLIGVTTPCPCIGSTYGLIGLDSVTLDRVMGAMVLALLAGSLYFIVIHCRTGRWTRFTRRIETSQVVSADGRT